MLNLCGIMAAIFKMAIGRNFSMSGINSGHHNLLRGYLQCSENGRVVTIAKTRHKKWAVKIQHCPISNNVEFLRYCGSHFENVDL
jgi:hypothetical protein